MKVFLGSVRSAEYRKLLALIEQQGSFTPSGRSALIKFLDKVEHRYRR